MERIGIAWSGLTASCRFLFWALIAAGIEAVCKQERASTEALAFTPNKPQDCWNAGYALFAYELSFDTWQGRHRAATADPQLYMLPQYEVRCWAGANGWDGVPFHKVTFPESFGLISEIRAVRLSYCEKHLRIDAPLPMWKAAA